LETTTSIVIAHPGGTRPEAISLLGQGLLRSARNDGVEDTEHLQKLDTKW